ncbi:Protein MOTHER of FT and TFL1 [Vitis vinifera]|uniref:Protein MOTHER of FT and TFL1 n=1 Tax=Vitis vinifera TaxID=29760 RepID=A0A438EF73_VITVI|nr:Protein MOTHER of FT and TFL1 [Vitis vinifera]
MFTPAAEFTVHYGSRQVANGRMIPPSAAVDKPKVQIHGHRLSSNLYTLVMVDPDAPSPSEPNIERVAPLDCCGYPRGMRCNPRKRGGALHGTAAGRPVFTATFLRSLSRKLQQCPGLCRQKPVAILAHASSPPVRTWTTSGARVF